MTSKNIMMLQMGSYGLNCHVKQTNEHNKSCTQKNKFDNYNHMATLKSRTTTNLDCAWVEKRAI